MARQRPTASNDVSGLPPVYRPRPTPLDTLTRSEAHALSRCAPLKPTADPASPAVSNGHWEVAAKRDQVPFLRRQVAAFAALAGMPTDDLPELQVALTEAVINAVLHAYRDRERAGDVLVDAETHDGELNVRVRDHGRGIEPRADSAGLGLGLLMIERFAGSCSVRRCEAGGTEVSMYFPLEGNAVPESTAAKSLAGSWQRTT